MTLGDHTVAGALDTELWTTVVRRFHGLPVLVTGGGGFIGSHLTDELVDLGAKVTVVDDCSAGDLDNLESVEEAIMFHEIDIRDRQSIRSVLDREVFEVVFHLAANAHVPTSVERPRYDLDVNVGGTQVVLEESLGTEVDRLVFASSAAVYGPPQRVPMDESHPLSPVSPYGAAKLGAEKLGLAYHESYDLDVTALRIFNTYGPRQSRYVMYDFLRKLEEDPTSLEVMGSGEQIRTFSYVSDTVAALLALGAAEDTPGAAYNFGGDEPIRILDLAEIMAKRYAPEHEGETTVHTTGEDKLGDIERLVSDNSRINELGVRPTVSLIDGLDLLYEWYENKD